MKSIKDMWMSSIILALRSFAEAQGVELPEIPDMLIQRPPRPELGDIAVPMFPYAKVFRMAPQVVASGVAEHLERNSSRPSGRVVAEGPYINITADISVLASDLFNEMQLHGEQFGQTEELKGKRVMIEFSCPNTNKPLHLGHLRNDALGESVSEILKANGAEVRKVNLINDRGVHICKSMYAYTIHGNGATPESTGKKSDHFVGDYYVKFAKMAKEDPAAEEAAQDMLRAWEDGDPEVTKLWRLMNDWTISGIEETYAKTGISFDQVYYESQTYKLGKSKILGGVESGVFYRSEDGTVWVDLEDIGLDKKVLLRKDGTSLYLTQDIGTALQRYEDWPFERLIYVVGSEQKYHFKVLFHVLGLLGNTWADDLHHLSYGMVNLPDGRMKSREGTVVDADDLIEQLTVLAGEEIRSKEREDAVGDVEQTATLIARAAINYYLLQVSPTKDMVFNPEESISFNGNTGPYLQYMGARISSMLKKLAEQDIPAPDQNTFRPECLVHADERELVKLVASFPDVVTQAGREMNPAVITAYVYELAKTYSRFYHDHPILKAESNELVIARVALSGMVLQTLKNAFKLIGIPFLEIM